VGVWGQENRIGRAVLGPLARRLRVQDRPIARGPAAGLLLNARGGSLRVQLGTYELAVQERFSQLVRPGATVYDVGANVGLYTLLAARLVGAAGTVVAYEPAAAIADVLERNVRLNGFATIRVRRVAVGAAAGEAALVTREVETGATVVEGEGGIRVPVVCLDDELAAGLPAPDVVKIDVEGGELDVLAGMAEILRACRPVLLCEMHGLNREVAAALRPLGYELAAVESDDPVETAPWWVHVVATPRP